MKGNRPRNFLYVIFFLLLPFLSHLEALPLKLNDTLVTATANKLNYLTNAQNSNENANSAIITDTTGNVRIGGGFLEVSSGKLAVTNNMIEVSIGDYILSGGDLAAMVLIDSVVRCLPNVLGNPLTLNEETFTNYLLEYPLYTQPREWKNYNVPNVLLSGDHKKIKNWKIKQSEDITMQRRPDLWKKYLKLK